MAEQPSPSSSFRDSSLSSVPPSLVVPDARSARGPAGYFLQPFKLAAVGYAAACGKSQRAATAPNQKWAADITYIHTDEGFLYLAGVVDRFSRKIVGWSLKDTLHADLCVEALEMALAHRRPKHSVLHHSDRGRQYAGKQCQDKLNEFTLECGMSRVGNCWDNAVVESLWASLKNERVFQRNFQTKQQARDAIFEWIVIWYNRKRRHSSLGYLSPEAFEAQQN